MGKTEKLLSQNDMLIKAPNWGGGKNFPKEFLYQIGNSNHNFILLRNRTMNVQCLWGRELSMPLASEKAVLLNKTQ